MHFPSFKFSYLGDRNGTAISPSFDSEQALKKWALTSTFGSENFKELTIDDKRVVVAFRYYTSGVKSSDVSVYYLKNKQWHLVVSHEPVFRDHVEVEKDGRNLIFKTGKGETFFDLPYKKIKRCNLI